MQFNSARKSLFRGIFCGLSSMLRSQQLCRMADQSVGKNAFRIASLQAVDFLKKAVDIAKRPPSWFTHCKTQGGIVSSFRELIQSMTTSDVAAACGVSQAMASLIRSGERAITIRRLAAFIANTGADDLDIKATVEEEAKRADYLAQERRAGRGR